MGHLGLGSHTWPRLLQLKLTLHFLVFLPQTLYQSGWGKVKSWSQTFSRWRVIVLLPSYSLMK
ncbi:hypothetical protein Goari_025626 [Gossypium aridum]|uniref:Uncharacterized protein n=1 Tax=Gossypium aridum TaxID=34290 RepID=A0A7J8X9Q1_GOSAI|nr:hypothetical protein [Gossypium aridum]